MSNQKVAIVTGCNSGIGRASAIALANEGLKFTVAARRVKEGEETVRLIKDAGSDAIFVKTDVANENDCQVACRENSRHISVGSIMLLIMLA